MAAYNYPSPIAPSFAKPKRVEDCLPRARFLVKKLAPSDPVPRGVISQLHLREGDRILIGTVPDQDPYIKEAVTQALMEQGAQKVDFISAEELTGQSCNAYSVEDGWRELDLYTEGKASGTLIDLITGLGLGEAMAKYLDRHPEYTGVFLDVAGVNTRRALGKHGHKFMGFWPFNNWEWFLSKVQSFPLELLKELEKRVVEPLGEAFQVRLTDPEGTHLEYSLTAEQAKRWQFYALFHGHLFMDPYMATSGELRLSAIGAGEDSLECAPIFHDLNGVLAGTANHCGFFPRLELNFEHTRLVEVKGGGRYGDGIRELMNRHRDIQWPNYPGTGLFWFVDTALCTSVGAFRRTSDMFHSYWVYPNLPERTRAGVFHLGFGSRIYRTEEEFQKYAQQYNLPRGHIHVHNYFLTFEVKIRGTQYWHKIVDKGYLSCLEDPGLRAIASRYGDPDELLSYVWIPPLPGINCEGDYLKDYAPDPIAYLKKRMKEGKPI